MTSLYLRHGWLYVSILGQNVKDMIGAWARLRNGLTMEVN
jgi:hypothetical protein